MFTCPPAEADACGTLSGTVQQNFVQRCKCPVAAMSREGAASTGGFEHLQCGGRTEILIGLNLFN